MINRFFCCIKLGDDICVFDHHKIANCCHCCDRTPTIDNSLLISKCCLTQSHLLHRLHQYNSCPSFSKTLHFINSSVKGFFQFLFRIDFKPTAKHSKSMLLIGIVESTFFDKAYTWNRSCCMLKPHSFATQTLCFFELKTWFLEASIST